MQATIGPDGHRSSAFTAFIQPHLGSRKNLHVAIGAFVTKIIFQKTSDPYVFKQKLALGSKESFKLRHLTQNELSWLSVYNPTGLYSLFTDGFESNHAVQMKQYYCIVPCLFS